MVPELTPLKTGIYHNIFNLVSALIHQVLQ